MTQLWKFGAGELASMIAEGETSSVEVVNAHLDRIDAVNPQLNAITRVLADDARAAARIADDAVAAGAQLGPLHGVPCTVKQNIDLVGSATNWGMPAFADAIPPVDSPVVARVKSAGAIPIGRTNCPDMALRVHTDSGLFGLTRNPWDPTRTAGGSSGGEASALAAGMTPIGIGNDIGGSLRNPASCCGIASIKPSAGRVANCTLIPSADGPLSFQVMPTEGPMARRIADVRLGLTVMAGRDRRDPYSLPLADVAPRDRGRSLRIAVLSEPPGGATDARVAQRVRAAADVLTDAGHVLVDSEPPRFAEGVDLWGQFLINDVRGLMPLIGGIMSDDANAFIGRALDHYPAMDLGDYTGLLMARQSLMRDWAMWFNDVDVLLTPTWTQLPFAHGWDVADDASSLATLELMRCVTHANLLGLPSACVTAGLVDGVPVGVLLTADRFADGIALDAAETIEDAFALPLPIDPN